MSRLRPLRYKHRLMVAAGLAYVIAGPLLMVILFTVLVEWFLHHLLTLVYSFVLMVAGVSLFLGSTADVDLVMEAAVNEGCLLVLKEEEARLRQMSRLHNTLMFTAITAYAIASFFFMYLLEPVSDTIFSNRAWFVFCVSLVYFAPLAIICALIPRYTSSKYRDLKPILDAAEMGFYEEIYHRYYDRIRKAKAKPEKK